MVLDIAPGSQIASPGELAELSIYRFVRESVLNAMRHGRASLIRVTREAMQGGTGQIVVRVTDNGVGPQTGHGRGHPTPSFGQIGMQGRARALGATYLPPWRDDTMTHTELRMRRP